MSTEPNLTGTWLEESPDGGAVDDQEADPSSLAALVALTVDAGTGAVASEAPAESAEPALPDMAIAYQTWGGDNDLFVFDAGYAVVQADPVAMDVEAVGSAVLFNADLVDTLPDGGVDSLPAVEPADDQSEAADSGKAADATSDQAEVGGDGSGDASVDPVDLAIGEIPVLIEPVICILIIDPIVEELPVAVICPAPIDEPGQLYYSEAICGLTDAAIPVALAI